MNATAAALVGVAYLLGSVSFAVLLVRIATGKDIRARRLRQRRRDERAAERTASGWALLVAALDIGKGALAVFLVRLVTADPRYAAAAGFAAILGHVFPIFYGFRGGKGVATAVGRVSRPRALGDARVHRDLRPGRRRHEVRLARLGGRDGRCCRRSPASLFRAPRSIVMAAAGAAILIVLKHRENLQRLASGKERRLGEK